MPAAMKTSKLVMAVLAVSAFFGALALASVGCTSNDLSTPTGCVAAYADAGNTYACAVEWSCNNSETYEIECPASLAHSGSYTCTCTTNTSTMQSTVTTDSQGCDLDTGALVLASACGYVLQM